MIKIKYLLLVSSLLLITSRVFSQDSGIGFLKNYHPWEYKASQQNWMITQDHRGIMYFANNEGVLEYDGVNWRLLELPVVRSIAFDEKSKMIYVGLESDLGYIKPDSLGNLQFHSLKDQLPENERDIGIVYNLHILKGKAIFVTYDRLFIYQNGSLKIIRSNKSFHMGFIVNNDFYLREVGTGLFKVVNDTLTFFEGSERFADERIDVMLPYSNNDILMVSRQNGLLFFSPSQHKFTNSGAHFKEVNKFLLEKSGYSGKKLRNGQYAIGSPTGGIIIFDSSGKITSTYNIENGLQDNTAFNIFQDKHDQLWVGLDNGISLINYNIPFKLYDKQVGLKGSPICHAFWKEKLYVGTSQYLYVLNEEGIFEALKGTAGQNFQLYNTGDELLVASYMGLLQVEDKEAKRLSSGFGTLAIIPLKGHSNKLLLGTSDGLYIFQKIDSRWRMKNRVIGYDKYAYMLVEDTDGTIWVSNLVNIFRIKLNDQLDSTMFVKTYTTSHGLPSDYCNPFKLNDGKVIFGTMNGIYAYNYNSDSFIPHKQFPMISGIVSIFKQKPNGDIWFDERDNNDNYERGILKKVNGKYTDYRTPFKKFSDLGSNESGVNLTLHSSGKVYFGTSIGLLVYDPSLKVNYNRTFNTLLRRITSRDSVLYNGNVDTEKDFRNITGIEIPFFRNSLVFNFASTSYEDSEKNLYSYRLLGEDSTWSAWVKDNKKEYSNLSEGNYKFQVKSKNQYGALGSVASYSFTILPPWYRTIWAFIGYILLFMLVMYLVVQLRTRKFRKRSKLLEHIVLERTKEIQEQKVNIEKLSRIGRDITSSLSIENIIQTIYQSVNTLMDATIFTIGLYKPESNLLEFPATIEKNVPLPPFTISLNDEDRLATWCFNNKKEVIIDSYADDYKKFVKRMAPPIAGEAPESILYFPLWNKNKIIGVISAQSFSKFAYNEYHVNVLRNLATYSAIALENAEAYRNLALLFDDLKATQDRLVTQSKLAALGELTAGIAHEIQNPLNFVNNFSEVSSELVDEMRQELDHANINDAIDISERLKLLLDKINYHGKRADAIVKGMLQHSASSGGVKEPTDINSLIDEFLRLSYHGLKAKDKSFHAVLKTDFDQSIGKVDITAQDIGRAVLNLITNSFYAVSEKRKLVTSNGDVDENYEPVVSVSTRRLNNSIEIEVSDNGIGISPLILDKIFQPFFTTKPPGEGTGLGLSLCHDIITKGHGGEIKVETKEGEGSTFLINLPLKK